MNIIKESGFYLSEPIYYQDIHAGNKIESKNYKGYWFRDNYVLRLGKADNNLFLKAEFLNQDIKGSYTVGNGTLLIVFDQGSKFEVTEKFIIASLETLKSESGIKYRFTPW